MGGTRAIPLAAAVAFPGHCTAGHIVARGSTVGGRPLKRASYRHRHDFPLVVVNISPICLNRTTHLHIAKADISAGLVHKPTTAAKQLRIIKLTDYTTEKVGTVCTGIEDLCACSAYTTERTAIIEQLAEGGIEFQTLAAQASKPDVHPFDLHCQLPINAPVLTRRQRAGQLKKQQGASFTFYAPEVREVLQGCWRCTEQDGEVQSKLPEMLNVPRSPLTATLTRSGTASAAQTSSAPPSTNSNRFCMQGEARNPAT